MTKRRSGLRLPLLLALLAGVVVFFVVDREREPPPDIGRVPEYVPVPVFVRLTEQYATVMGLVERRENGEDVREALERERAIYNEEAAPIDGEQLWNRILPKTM